MPLKISVILPVYNGADFVAEAVKSVLAQSYPAYEIIVVNDGSTDDTLRILERFGGRIRVHTIPNGGLSNARNVGISLATGDCLAFIDHDDVWFRSKLLRQAEALERHREVGLVTGEFITRYDHYGRYELVRHYSRIRTRGEINFNAPLREHAFGLLMLENFIGAPSAVMIRRSVIERVGRFDPGFRLVEDLDYFLRCAAVTPFLVLSAPLIYKRTRGGNLSSDRVRMWEYHLRALQRNLKTFRPFVANSGLESRCHEGLAHAYYALGDSHYEAGRFSRAFACYGRGWRCRPVGLNAARFLARSFRKLVRMASGDRISRKRAALAFGRAKRFLSAVRPAAA